MEEAHRQLVDQVVEVDEKLMERYLEKGEVSPEELHEPLERALREGHLIPVVFTSAKTGAGIAELLEVIVKLLPNPTEGNPPAYVSTPAGGEPTELVPMPDPGRHVLAHVFKIEIDPYIGRLAVFRVHQGRLTPGTQLYVGEGRKPIKPGHLYLLRGKTQTEVSEALPGDICAIAKVDEIQFDQILHDSAEDAHMHARPLELPTSVFGLAVQSKKRGDEQKVSDVLHKIMAEDPCFRIEHNAQANETVMRGLGEMHLRTVLEKMASQYKLELDTRPPSIPYRETIASKAEGHSRHKKQTGGAGQFGEVYLKVEPLPRGKGFEFVDSVKGGAIPNQFIPSVEKGVRERARIGLRRRLPAAGRARHRLRRQEPPGRLEGRGVHVRRAQGLPRRAGQGAPDRARADRQRRDHRARQQDGRHRRRALRAPRPDQGLGHAASRPGADHRAGAALRARAFPGAAEVAHRRPRLLPPGVQPLRARAAAPAAEARRRAPARGGRGVM